MIPVGDSPRSRTTPFVNYLIIALNVAVFAWMFTLGNGTPSNRLDAQREFVAQTNGECYGYETAPTEIDRFFCRYSLQPREFVDNLRGELEVPDPDRGMILLTILTSIFLQAGWLHIIGNMLFLWVFGDNVEDRLGHFGYLLFYVAAGIVASLVQISINPESVTPVIGASGAVAGVLGAYIVYFTHATVRVVIPFFILIFIPIPIPAWVMIGAWFLQNLLSGYATLSEAAVPDAGVAWFAHIGGFIFGLGMAWLFIGRRRTGPAPPWE
ncbi:MAG: rhomboid family intramembrane serine protease [Anaerolinea sp.]|nr:rhomboid family intramembrane serine protease [Anaerolinea sp.]